MKDKRVHLYILSTTKCLGSKVISPENNNADYGGERDGQFWCIT